MLPNTQPRDTITIPFYVEIPQSSNKTVKSQSLNFFYTTRTVAITFALNTNRLVRVYPIISLDDQIPKSGMPSGQQLFAPYGQVKYLVGDDQTVRVKHETTTFQKPSWITLYIDNLDTYDHTIHAHVTIQRAIPTSDPISNPQDHSHG